MQLLNRLHKFLPKDKKKFDDNYKLLSFPLAEHSFAWVYMWRDTYKDIEWTEINGNLCLFLTFDRNRCVWGPVFPGNRLADTIKKCISICESYNANRGYKKKPAVMYIPEELKGHYLAISGMQIEGQEQDYIYNAEEIKGLSGVKMKDKRNKRNYFVKNYKFSAEKYKKEHKKGCLELLKTWEEQKRRTIKDSDFEKLNEEVAANIHALDEAESLGVKGIVIFVDGKIEGYIFGEFTNQLVCTLFFGKTNLDVKGLSQFIYSEFIRMEFNSCKFVNDGEGWGVNYLNQAKQSYNPTLINKSYMLVQNE